MKLKEKVWLLEQKVKMLEDEKLSLKQELEMEKTCARIDRILDKENYDKMYKTCLEISRDFLRYVESHPNEDETDTEIDSDEDSDWESSPVTSEEEEELIEIFRIKKT